MEEETIIEQAVQPTTDIDKKIITAKPDAAVAMLQSGRMTPSPEVEKYKKQLEPTKHLVYDHSVRPDKLVKTDEAVDMNSIPQENRLLDLGQKNRTANVRPEPVSRIAVSLQELIVKRAVSFLFGNPVTLLAEAESDKENEVLKSVKSILYDVKSTTLNRKIARTIFSATEAAELWYVVPSPNNRYGFDSKYKLRVAVFDPLKGDKLFPYFDDTGDLIAFSREYSAKDTEQKTHNFFETYTAEYIYRWETTDNKVQLIEGYPKKNAIGKIPVIYGRQNKTEWADVQGLIERYEKLLSNFADCNDYHASPKIIVKGRIKSWAKKGETGGVIEMEDDGDAHYMSWEQAPEAVKLEEQTLFKLIHSLTQTPDISFDTVKGIGNITGIALELMFMDAHLKVQDKKEQFVEFLQRRYSIIQSYLKVMNKRDADFVKACDTLGIEPDITPYIIKDEAGRINALMQSNGNQPIASQRTTIEQYGKVDDVDAEIERIREEQGTTSVSDLLEQEPSF